MLRSFLGIFLFFAAACGGDVVATPGQSGDEGSGSGAAAVASSGAGGATSSAVGSASTAGVGGSPMACGDSYVEVTDIQGSAKLGSICAQSWGAKWSSTPVGFYVNGGPAPGIHALEIEGCASSAAESEGLRLGADGPDVPGTYAGTAVYRDAQGQDWADMGASVELTLDKVGPVGDVIEASYVAHLFHGAGVLDLKGAFRVCHVEDENVP